MPSRAEKLSLKGFRGATCPSELVFDSGKSIVLIFGENGTGKSSLVDALDFVCNGNLGSLADRSVGASKARFLPSLGKQDKDLGVCLDYGGQQWTASLVHGVADIKGPASRPVANILRRSQILRIVDRQPRERYEALKTFVAVPGVEACESSLRDAAKTAAKDYDDAVKARNLAQETLRRLWQAEGGAGPSCKIWAAEKVKVNLAQLKDAATQARTVLEAFVSCKEKRDAADEARQILLRAQANLATAEKALRDGQASALPGMESLVGLLQQTQQYLKSDSQLKVCPVCERDVDTRALAVRIEERLREMKKLVVLMKSVDAARRTAEQESHAAARAGTDYLTSARKLAVVVLGSRLDEVARAKLRHEDFASLVDARVPLADKRSLSQADRMLAAVQGLQQNLVTRHDTAQRDLAQLNAIKTQVGAIEDAETESVELSRLSKRLVDLLAVVERERKSYVEAALSSVTGAVEQFYSRIHPGEGIGKIRFYLKPNVAASLEFDGQFLTATDVPPQAYYSESHLDTLGVCVFLALAKQFNDGNSIVVLDDVFTSVDDAHLAEFMQLLHDEAVHFNQLVITTHYRAWRDRYRYARGAEGHVQLIELLHWALPRGVRSTKTKVAIAELRSCLTCEPIRRNDAASESGVLLESVLDHLALLYRGRLPRQAQPSYVLGDLLDSLPSKFTKLLTSEKVVDKAGATQKVQLQPLLNAISELTWIRNQVGCHFNTSGMSLADSEVKKLAERTMALTTALACPECNMLPSRNRSGCYWECQCGRTKLHPLVQPGAAVPPTEG